MVKQWNKATQKGNQFWCFILLKVAYAHLGRMWCILFLAICDVRVNFYTTLLSHLPKSIRSCSKNLRWYFWKSICLYMKTRQFLHFKRVTMYLWEFPANAAQSYTGATFLLCLLTVFFAPKFSQFIAFCVITIRTIFVRILKPNVFTIHWGVSLRLYFVNKP